MSGGTLTRDQAQGLLDVQISKRTALVRFCLGAGPRRNHAYAHVCTHAQRETHTQKHHMHTSTCNKDAHTARKLTMIHPAPRHPLTISTPGALLKMQKTYKFRVHTHPRTHAHSQAVYAHVRAHAGGNFSLQGAGLYQRHHRSFRGARTAVLHHIGDVAAHLDCIPCVHEQQRYCFCLIRSMCVLSSGVFELHTLSSPSAHMPPGLAHSLPSCTPTSSSLPRQPNLPYLFFWPPFSTTDQMKEST